MTTRRRPNRRIASVLMTLALVGGLLSVAAPAQAAGVTVSGTVRGVDGGGTIPLHGALVGFYPLTGSGDPFGFALTNAAGAYSIQGVPAGQYRVRFDPPNTTHAATWLFGQPLEYSSVLLNVTTTPVTGVNTTLPLGSIVSGTVSVDGSLGGATVEVTLFRLDPSGRIDRFPLRATSLTNGNFNIQGVPAGSYQLRFATDAVEIATTYWSGAQLRTDAGTIVISTPGTYGSFAGVVSTSTGAPTIGRLAGADRYSTAVEISKAGWPFGADALFIVSGQGFADALSAGAAAASIDAPMLLVTRDSVPEVVAAEITRLDPANVYVVGGESVISNQTFNDVLDFTGSVTLQRIAGADRYETSRIVSDRFFDNSTFAYLATGTNFPDALGAGPAAAVDGGPLILVNGAAAAPDAATTELLTDLGVTAARVVGGTGVISAAYESALVSPSIREVYRNSGPDRYTTAVAVGGAFRLADFVFLATGTNFPDALAGSAFAGGIGAPIFLVQPNCVPVIVQGAMQSLKPSRIILLGGESVLGPGVLSLTTCPT